jgi:hypothetical protein
MVNAMIDEPVMSERDEQTRRALDDPTRFPVGVFKRLIILGGFYRANARAGEEGSGDSLFGIPWAAVERAGYADIVTVVSRVFITDAARLRLHRKHFLVWLAVECGILIESNAHGTSDWRYAFPEKPKKVMDESEAGKRFGLEEETVREYHDAAAAALDKEWFWLKTRER